MLHLVGALVFCACGTTVIVSDENQRLVKGATVYMINADNPYQRVPDEQDRITNENGEAPFGMLPSHFRALKVVVTFGARSTVVQIENNGKGFQETVSVKLSPKRPR
jgi:hypothetical protein